MTEREIDYLLATRVMDWTLIDYETCEPVDDPKLVWETKAGHSDGWSWEGQEEANEAWMWEPTINPEWAKRVREKLAERYSDSSLLFDRDWPEAPYEFHVWNNSNEESPRYDMVVGKGETEELAVALCALRSVGIEAEVTE